MPRVSVVVPAFNAAEYLPPTLDSVINGSYRDFEVIVIDDGSSDRTAEVAAGYGRQVRVIRQPNRGMSASRNRGILEMDSEFVALLDADDVWHPRKLELQVDSLSQWSRAGLSFTEFFCWDGASLPVFNTDVDLSIDPKLSGLIYRHMLLTNFVLPSSALFKYALVDVLGPFLCDDQQTDDWEYFVRASREFEFVKLKAQLVAYRQSASSLSKRPRPVNVTENMRSSLIERFGLAGPDGISVDLEQLTYRRYKSNRDFADAHVVRGDLAVGLARFGSLLTVGPRRLSTLYTLVRALRRRFLQ